MLTNQFLTRGVTAARKSVLDFFIKQNRPINVKDFKAVKIFDSFNESSIYRNIHKLEEAGIIHAIPDAGEFQSYELVPKGHHHHHISCVKCKTIQCLDMCGLDKRMHEIANSVGFTLTGHSVELMGLCKKCS